MLDNVVHYEVISKISIFYNHNQQMFQVKGRRNPVPIYDFDDFGPIHHYEMHAAQKLLLLLRGSLCEQ